MDVRQLPSGFYLGAIGVLWPKRLTAWGGAGTKEVGEKTNYFRQESSHEADN